jgi:hypothetical protein
MKTVLIYTLSDKDGNVRYVGKTEQYLKQRLYSHLNECKSNKKSYKISWLKSLLNKGERPLIEVIDEVPDDEWEFWEKYWIAQLSSWGIKLTNLTSGGGGGSVYNHTDESKKKMRKSKLGIPLSKEHKVKISKGVKMKARENPNYNRSGANLKQIINRDLIYKLYITENLSERKVAEILKCSKKKVHITLNEYGIEKSKDSWRSQLSTTPIKVVLQYDMDGNFIKEWPEGPSHIHRETGIEVARCCRGLMKTSKGYIWKYKDGC